MKKILMPVFVVLCFLVACKEETPSGARVQAGKIAPLTSDSYTPPAPLPEDQSIDGFVAPRYAADHVNDYQRADSLVGEWAGVEGTSLIIERDGDEYKITLTNLDGSRSFAAKAGDGGLVFERDGAKELIRAGDGIDTGMKWLADKLDCVVVTQGSEGFCRE